MKLLKRLLVLVSVLAIMAVGTITIKGYVNYIAIVDDIGLNETIDEILASEDYVPLNKVSDTFVHAVVSTEDRRFYEHNGIDYISIGRAMLTNIKARRIVAGGSTITQQLSKNLFLSFDQTFERKATEYFIARHIEKVYSKDEILGVYINVINYGEGCFGIKEASQHYFNKRASELCDSQAVLLAGLPQAPSNLSLTRYYDEAVIRSEVVLKSMLRNKVIVEEDVERLYAEIREGIK